MNGDCNVCRHRVYLPNRRGKLIASCDTAKCKFEAQECRECKHFKDMEDTPFGRMIFCDKTNEATGSRSWCRFWEK